MIIGGLFLRLSYQLRYIFTGQTGDVVNQLEWPKPLLDIVAESRWGIQTDSIQVYSLNQGFDPEYVWRMKATPDLLDQLAQDWRLTEIYSPDWRNHAGSHNSRIMVPAWWDPGSRNCRYFISDTALNGAKGAHYHVAYDDESETYFIHYWFNF